MFGFRVTLPVADAAGAGGKGKSFRDRLVSSARTPKSFENIVAERSSTAKRNENTESERSATAKFPPVFRQSDSYGGYCPRSLDDVTDTHLDTSQFDDTLQFLVDLIGNKADTDMCFNSPFCKVKHGTHVQSSL